MEAAPLTLAHNHARNAALETKRSNPVAASEEHDLAAAEFAAAAQGTADSEALRILSLLEEHHKKLGQLLKASHERPSAESAAPVEKGIIAASTEKEKSQETAADTSTKDLEISASHAAEVLHRPPRLTRTVRPTARDLSSSIASNLASARGIPNSRQRRPEPISPTLSNQHAGGRFARDSDSTKAGTLARQGSEQPGREILAANPQHGKPSWAPPTIAGEYVTASQEAVDENEETKTQSLDAPFQQFYNAFETLVSKISAPLAFAGLPLTATTAPNQTPVSTQTPKSKIPKAPSSSILDSSIDYSALISRAALRAVRDGYPSTNSVAESFYVVPTTGGTISYADIMNRAEREGGRHHRNLSAASEDDFFDARSEIPVSELQGRSDGGGAKRKGTGLGKDTKTVAGKTMEELALENQALKHLSDTLSKRLHVFELSAQSSSAALAQSIRSLQYSPLTTPENSGRGREYDSASGKGGGDDRARARIMELEEILRKSERDGQRKRDENVKLKDTILKYREKWERLKEGARARREIGGPSGPMEKETAHGNGTESPNLGLGAPVEPETDDGRRDNTLTA